MFAFLHDTVLYIIIYIFSILFPLFPFYSPFCVSVFLLLLFVNYFLFFMEPNNEKDN